MVKSLRVLIVEDSEDDALLAVHELKRGGYEPTWERVDTAKGMSTALSKQTWDVIIADYRMPNFSAPAALKLLQKSGLDLPFIIVSGTIGEDTAVEAMRSGAHDYMMKDNLKRLVPAIEREISDAEVRWKRQQAENGIRKAAEEWRTTFDAISDLISIHDSNYKITRVNRAFAKVFKMEPKELIGKTCYEVVHGESEPPLHCPHKRALETGKPEAAEFFETHLDVYLGVTASPIFNEKGKVVRTVHIAKDITERKKIEEQLIVTDRLASVGELVSGVAHEVNNPLTSIVGFSELLLAANAPDAVKEDLKVINKEAQRASKIVRNLLIFARRHKPEKQMVDVNDAIQAALDLRTYEQKVNNVMAIKYFASDLPKITADGFQLRQVFLNLIINAEYFMLESHGKGTLDIKTEQDRDIIRISFTDDGPGIPEENVKHLFDPFFTTKEVGKGTGLGLSICHGIITEHGGRIYAKSDLGKGATFVVELPVR